MRSNRYRWLWMFPLVWMAVIFMLSSQPGEESHQLSGQVLEIVEEIVERFRPEPAAFDLHTFVRKSAHYGFYLVLGILLYIPLYFECRQGLRSVLWSFFIGTWYAVLDEIHQLFVPGRSFQVTDILIDSLGVLTGAFVCCGVVWLMRPRFHDR